MRSIFKGLPAFLLILVGSCSAQAQSFAHPPGGYVNVNGAKLWYESEGHGDVLVLIAGGPGSSHDYFHSYFSRLTGRYRVIYFDAFGTGKSDKAAKPSEYSFGRDVENLEGLRQTLNLGKISLFGYSYGSLVAQAYAMKHPELVRSLILSNPFISGDAWGEIQTGIDRLVQDHFPEIWDQVETLRKNPASASRDAKIEELMSSVPPAMIYDYDPEKEAEIAAKGATFSSEVYAAINPGLTNLDFRKTLGTLKCPILILAGRSDRIAIPRLTRQFQIYVPQANYVIFEKSGHSIFLEEPDRFVQVLDTFLVKQ
jgi:proline iminopeptidase